MMVSETPASSASSSSIPICKICVMNAIKSVMNCGHQICRECFERIPKVYITSEDAEPGPIRNRKIKKPRCPYCRIRATIQPLFSFVLFTFEKERRTYTSHMCSHVCVSTVVLHHLNSYIPPIVHNSGYYTGAD